MKRFFCMKQLFGFILLCPSAVYAQFFSNWPQMHFHNPIGMIEICAFLILVFILILGGYLYGKNESNHEPYRSKDRNANEDE